MKTRSLPSTLVFVYGTLKRGGAWSHLLSDCEFMGSGMTLGRYPMIIDTIPYVLDENMGHQIYGEMYRVDLSTMRALDALEQHPNWYERKKKRVIVGGEPFNAYIYFLTPACYDQLGNWSRRPFHAVYPIETQGHAHESTR